MRSPTFYDSTLSSGPMTLSEPSGGDYDGIMTHDNITLASQPAGPPAPARWGAPLGAPCALDLSWLDGLVFCDADLVRCRLLYIMPQYPNQNGYLGM